MSASLRLDRLELRDRLAERLALLRVRQRLVQRALREADAHRRDADAPDVEDVQELLEAVAARAEQVLLRHPAVLERQRPRVRRVPAHLAVRLALLVAGRAVLDDEVRDLAVARPRGDRDVAGELGARVGDELLGAVDDPLAALERRPACARCRRPSPPRARSARTRRACGPRRGPAGSAPSARRSRRGRSAACPSDVCAHIVIATDESTRVSSSTASAYCSDVPPAPPTSSGNGIPIQPELAHLADDVGGERLRAVELLGDRRDLALGELADRPPQHLVIVGQVEEHARQQYRMIIRSSNGHSTRLRRDRGHHATPPTRAPRALRPQAAAGRHRGRARVRRSAATTRRRCRSSPTRSGIAAGGLYHYFGSKEQLLIRICDALMDPLLDRGARAARRRRSRPRQQLRELIRLWVEHVVAHRDHMLVFQQERHVIEHGAQWKGVRDDRKAFERLVEQVLDARRHARPTTRASRCRRCSAWSTTPRSGSARAGGSPPREVADGYADLLLR